MVYEIYEGAFTIAPKKDRVLYRGEIEGETAMWNAISEVLASIGLKMERYMRFAETGGFTYVDFGSWSVFIRYSTK